MTTIKSHPLARYLKRSKISLREFSKRSGVDLSVLSLTLAGKRPRFSLAAAFLIDQATGGRVTFAQAAGIRLPRRRAAAA